MRTTISMTLAILLLLFSSPIRSMAQQHSISGFIEDSVSGERLIGATVYCNTSYTGVASNNFGFFSLPIIRDSANLTVSFIGYQSLNLSISLTKDTLIRIRLEAGHDLEAVVIRSTSNTLRSPQTSMARISMQEVKGIPSLTGDADVMKAYQLMPGISQGNEGTNGMFVRGGSPDQNLILLDDVPLYYVNHIGGFVSVFNESSINSVNVYKAGFPARYGGRLSSVMDIRMRDGSMTKTSGEVSLGLLSSKLALEGPLIRDRVSYSISARRSMTDLYLKPISRHMMNGEGYATYMFYDLNGKINYRITNRDRIFLSAYHGDDIVAMGAKTEGQESWGSKDSTYARYDYRNSFDNRWGNTMVCLRWNHVFGPKLFSNITLAGGGFGYRSSVGVEEVNMTLERTALNYSSGYSSGVKDLIAKIDFDYYPSPNHRVRMGAMVNQHNFSPGRIYSRLSVDTTALTDSVYIVMGYPNPRDTTYGSPSFPALESSVYIEDEFRLGQRLSVNAGLHLAAYHTSDTNFLSLQPRVIANVEVGSSTAIKASFSTMAQHMHMLTSSDANMPTDIWVPAMGKAPPGKATQYTLGAMHHYQPWGLELSLEGFYKLLSNLIEYKTGESLTSSGALWTEKVETNGKGQIYGFEALIRMHEGRLNGWVGYTWSKNQRQFMNIDNNVPFPFKFDRRHDLSVVANYQLTPRVNLSATWVVQSGGWITLGSATYDAMVFHNTSEVSQTQDIVYESDSDRYNQIGYAFNNALIYGTRNNYQMPPYHRLDLSTTFTRERRWGTREWVVGVYNAYNRMNAYHIYYKIDKGQVSLTKFTLLPIIPSVSYRYMF